MKAQHLRTLYLTFFQQKGHVVIPSASLIPSNDASVLFNTAGMQPLVPYLMGQKHPQGKRIVNIQKCLRTVDFDNIGDNTHHTFFQMLGNWSLGDYFKKDALGWSFEFLTSPQWLNIPLSMLAVTVYEGSKDVPRDEESYALWRSLGVPEQRIAFLGKDNFWIAGETGPCGPCSEMFYWTGDEKPPTRFDPNDNHWVEIWNDVFMSYNKLPTGMYHPLQQKNVDTGMGFERTLAVLSGKKSAYETDLFQPVIQKIEELTKKHYKQEQRPMRIIADHLRAAVFILGDDNAISPSNVDRGYILRRLIRRAVRYAKQINMPGTFTQPLAKIIIENYKEMYPELSTNAAHIYTELQKEEEKFEKTLEKGMQTLKDELAKISVFKKSKSGDLEGIQLDKVQLGKTTFSGKTAFLLFQSYGFPLEMTEEIVTEYGCTVDTKEFYVEYEKHKDTSRVGAEQKFKGGLADTSEMSVKYHTATHLLHQALRDVLGKEVQQKGSNITLERLRFDFAFSRKLTDEEKKKVEKIVNEKTKEELPVQKIVLPIAEAEKTGALHFFGGKYGEQVSVYFIGPSLETAYSKEFCGGPH
ncbi:TPA: alanine--tRNA ligase, partial [Candidatus Woesearchaeota archaeon]|nr:alanine--tRNA ligase [Candidatus Woesearchaeota archaeon]